MRAQVRGRLRVFPRFTSSDSFERSSNRGETVMELICIVIGLVIFALAAVRWGVDSRDDFREAR